MQAFNFPSWVINHDANIFRPYYECDVFKLFEGFDEILNDGYMFGIVIILQKSKKIEVGKVFIGAYDGLTPSIKIYSTIEMIRILKSALIETTRLPRTGLYVVKFKSICLQEQLVKMRQIINDQLDIYFQKIAQEKLELKSANIIIKSWRIANMDPNYLLCVRRLQNEYNELVKTL